MRSTAEKDEAEAGVVDVAEEAVVDVVAEEEEEVAVMVHQLVNRSSCRVMCPCQALPAEGSTCFHCISPQPELAVVLSKRCLASLARRLCCNSREAEWWHARANSTSDGLQCAVNKSIEIDIEDHSKPLYTCTITSTAHTTHTCADESQRQSIAEL